MPAILLKSTLRCPVDRSMFKIVFLDKTFKHLIQDFCILIVITFFSENMIDHYS